MGLGGFLFYLILLLLLLPNVNEGRPYSFNLLCLYSLIFLILLASYASAIFLMLYAVEV